MKDLLMAIIFACFLASISGPLGPFGLLALSLASIALLCVLFVERVVVPLFWWIVDTMEDMDRKFRS